MIFGGKGKKAKETPRAKPRSAVEIETIIGPNSSFKGDIQSSGGVRIDGDMEGSIDIAGNLIIGENATVIADVLAHNVQVQGVLQGDLTAERLEILDTGKLWGNITVDSFVLDDGGFYQGQSKMHGDAEPPLLEAAGGSAGGQVVDGEATLPE